ncbi:MAG: hypothetical protein KatS3mg036_1113 [Ignavibacterium sp.]|uniref:hypothetical protein n=1 Tax=Ignavibacterium sp. TaxID=2651167 RepID=UPI0021DD2EC7|nr:hypothetical protein [Ignavibacterium sp.]BDQ03739.1 MAG: hypothetical protein KatS3mg037_2314 [Ignavibacterium sp.]GIV46295.1 MAG: hypothetical protein KatS3mg036_1113 [Ignavibacterium sp.]
MKKILSLSGLILIVIVFFASEVLAIPAFARKYNMTCKTCHSPFPKLKPYAEEFAANGFVLKDQDAPRYFLDTGDPELSLIRDVPLAFRLEGYVTYNQSNLEKSDFNAPLLFKILSGGAITKDVAYYVYYILENGEPGKIEDAWLMFNDLFGSKLDFTIGQFQVSDPVFKRELRLTRDDYYIYKVRPGLSNVDLTYDRGIMLNYGFESGTDLTIEVVNGNGIGEGVSNVFDDDKYKNFFGRISQDAGEHLRLGALGYYGKEEKTISDITYTNQLWMVGGDATISFDPLELNLQYIERNDDNALFVDNKSDAKTRGAFGELIYRPEGDASKWYGVAIFNWIESDFRELNLKQLGVHFGYVLRRNIRLVAEYSHNFTDKYGKMNLGFVSAF